MRNPMLQNLNQNQIHQIKQMMKLVNSARNPQLMLNQIMMNNPQVKQVIDYVNQNGGDPKTAFYKLAEEKGIDPDDIIKQLS